MIYINGVGITDGIQQNDHYEYIKNYLNNEKIILVDDEGQPLNDEVLIDIINLNEDYHFNAVKIASILKEFKVELTDYIRNVEQFIENEREGNIENNSKVLNGFIDIIEALVQFISVEQYLQKKIVDQEQLNDLAKRTLIRAEAGDTNYVLDIIEYELLPILQQFGDEIVEEM